MKKLLSVLALLCVNLGSLSAIFGADTEAGIEGASSLHRTVSGQLFIAKANALKKTEDRLNGPRSFGYKNLDLANRVLSLDVSPTQLAEWFQEQSDDYSMMIYNKPDFLDNLTFIRGIIQTEDPNRYQFYTFFMPETALLSDIQSILNGSMKRGCVYANHPDAFITLSQGLFEIQADKIPFELIICGKNYKTSENFSEVLSNTFGIQDTGPYMNLLDTYLKTFSVTRYTFSSEVIQLLTAYANRDKGVTFYLWNEQGELLNDPKATFGKLCNVDGSQLDVSKYVTKRLERLSNQCMTTRESVDQYLSARFILPVEVLSKAQGITSEVFMTANMEEYYETLKALIKRDKSSNLEGLADQMEKFDISQ